jgi:hypothetical protein
MNITVPGCGFAIALLASPFASSAFVAPVPPNGVSSVSPIERVAARKSDQTARRQQSAPTYCAEVFMYWSAKDQKCIDARNKPSERPPDVPPEYWVPGTKGGAPACMRGKAGCG